MSASSVFFLPRVRENSAARASSRAMVTGQVVDTITNIKTVKLFAHAAYEDRVALDAMEVFRDRSLEFGVISTWFRFALMTLAGVLPVLLIGGTLLLWQQGQATAGDIAAAGAIAMRIAQMSGWVSFTLMSIYTSVGEVEDGMQHPDRAPHADRRAGCRGPAARSRARSRFDHVTFAYGRQPGRRGSDINLTIAPGEKLGIVGASGAGKSSLVSLLLRLYDTERGPRSGRRPRRARTSRRKACAARSAWSRRKPRCSTARPATTSSMAAPTRPRTR